MESNYVVKKLVGGTVFYQVPGEMKERTWKGDDARQVVPFVELEKCVYDPSTKSLFERGFLYIEDKKCRIALGLEAEDPTVINETKLIYTKEQMSPLLYEVNFEEFKRTVERLAEGSLELMFQAAINGQKQLATNKSDYLRKKFHIDVEKIQREKRDELEASKKEG